MNSKKTVSKQNTKKSAPPEPKHPPPHYKFLRRVLKVGNRDESAYRICYVKRFYFRKLIDTREAEDHYNTDYRLISRLYKNSKYLKTLKSSQTSSFIQPYVHDKLKMSRNLTNFSFSFDSDDETTERIVFYLKRLPPLIQIIHLEIFRFSPIPPIDLYNIAKALRRSRKLQQFTRSHYYHSDRNKSSVSKELYIYSQSASRLKDLKQMCYNVSNNEQAGFQRTMRRGFVYPGITGLRIDIERFGFAHLHQIWPFFEQEDADLSQDFSFDVKNMTTAQKRVYKRVQNDIKREDKEKKDDFPGPVKVLNNDEDFFLSENASDNKEVESDIDTIATENTLDGHFGTGEEFVARCMMLEEMRPFYRFELFPNLRSLKIIQTCHISPLGRFVVEGFKQLKNLESLEIQILQRPEGTKYFFKGFLHLPLLKKFSLYINFIQPTNWSKLEKFLQKQNNLDLLSLHVTRELPITSDYLSQNRYLEKIIKDLENKPKLKSLDLRSRFWSLEALSKGFSHLTMTNQLHTLKFEGSDETITSDEKLWKRVEGLCKFMKNQKESLRKLEINLPLALDDKLVTHVAEAASKLTELTDLQIKINSSSGYVKQVLIPYFEETFQTWVTFHKKLPSYEKWNPNLAKYLKKFQKLENFTLHFGVLNPRERFSAKWFGEVMKALPSLERLKTIKIMAFEDGAVKNEEGKIIAAMRELKNIKEIDFEFYDSAGEFTSSQATLDDIVVEIHAKQGIRTDLMF